MWKLVILALSCYIAFASTKCIYPKPATNLFVKAVKELNKNWYAHQRFGKPVHLVSDKCWRISTWFWYIKPDLTIRTPAIHFDENNARIDDGIVANILALKTKYYVHYNNTDYLVTDIILETDHFVSYICNMNNGEAEVTIFTNKQKRDEDLIKKATEKSSKILELPSPSQNTGCENNKF